MEFCILSPIAGLERYSTLSRHHLVLAHIQHPKYVEFYRRRKAAGDFLILDNSAYEGQQNNARLLHAIKLYSPDMVVLPDFLLEPWEKTWRASSEFLDNYFDQFECQWGYVPQSPPGDIMGWVEGLTHALQDSRIRWICLPRALGTDVCRDPLIRVNVCRYIRGFGKKVHALGMLSGSVDELGPLADAGCNSIDSNAPVWRGWCGVKLGQPWNEKPIYYEGLLETEYYDADAIILSNLEACNVNVNSRR